MGRALFLEFCRKKRKTLDNTLILVSSLDSKALITFVERVRFLTGLVIGLFFLFVFLFTVSLQVFVLCVRWVVTFRVCFLFFVICF